MASLAPTDVSSTQAQDMQRQLESVILKLEKATLLQEKAGDHIRVIVAEGIAESFGDRYRMYPTVPRPESVPIRRDLAPIPCVLAPPRRAAKKKANSKCAELVAATTSASSPGKTVTTTSRGTTKRVSAWAAGVANASSTSTSPEKSIIYETRLAANASRWDTILDNPIKLSPHASRASYTLTGRKIEKRAILTSPPKEDTRIVEIPATVEAGAIKKGPETGQSVINNTNGMVKMVNTTLDAVPGTSACTTPPKATPPKTSPPSPPTANTGPKTVNMDDWLIDLSS